MMETCKVIAITNQKGGVGLWKAIDYEKLMTPKPFPMRIIS